MHIVHKHCAFLSVRRAMAKFVGGNVEFIDKPFVFTPDWVLKIIVPHGGALGQRLLGQVSDMKFRSKCMTSRRGTEVADCFQFLVAGVYVSLKADCLEVGRAQRDDLRILINQVYQKKKGNHSALLRKSISEFVLLNLYSIMCCSISTFRKTALQVEGMGQSVS